MEEQIVETIKVEKEVNIAIPALNTTAVVANVKEYREDEGVYAFDLYDADGNLVAKDRYKAVADAPFKLTQGDLDIINPPVVDEEASEVLP